MLFEKMGLLETYEPKGADRAQAGVPRCREPYTWTGMDAYLSRDVLQHRGRPEGTA